MHQRVGCMWGARGVRGAPWHPAGEMKAELPWDSLLWGQVEERDCRCECSVFRTRWSQCTTKTGTGEADGILRGWQGSGPEGVG